MAKSKAKSAAGSKSRASKSRATGTRLKAATPAKRRSVRPAPAPSRTRGGRKSTTPPPRKSSPAPRSTAGAPGKAQPPAAQGTGQTNLRERLARLSAETNRIGALKRSLHKSFFDVGVILNRIRDERLYEVKGYGSFEAFLDREIDINKTISVRLPRVAEALTREAALEAGMERSVEAIAALDGDAPQEQPVLRATGSLGPVLPLHKQ